MRKIRKLVLVIILILNLALIEDSWSWPLGVHRSLAKKTAEKCVDLPRSNRKRCDLLVDENTLLYNSLMNGSVAPDFSQYTKKGESPRHAYNPGFNNSMAESVSRFYNVPTGSINRGLAIIAKDEEVAKLRDLLLSVNCNSTQEDYARIWNQFGVLSHYPADIAAPLHVYSVNVDGKYHEGDVGSDGKWLKG